MNNAIHELIIIGSGPAGLTAGIYAARANLNPLIVEGTAPGGQLMGTSIVENWPGISSILGPALMLQMRDHAKNAGVIFSEGQITTVDFSSRPFTLYTSNSATLHAKSIIIATGTIPNKLGCKGEDFYWGKGVTTCAVCDATLYAGKKVIIVGGGDSAMESASFLRKFTKDVTIVHILDTLTASHAMQQRIINDPTITIHYQSTVTEILGDGEKVTGVIITNQKTNESLPISTNGVFIAVGLKPNTLPFQKALALDSHGYVVVNNRTTATSVPGVFAAGDVADSIYRQAITSAGTGCMAALDVERFLKNNS